MRINNKYYFESRSKLEHDIKYIVKQRLGNGVYISGYTNKEKNELSLGVYIPKIIDDSKTLERRIRFLKFDPIGLMKIEKDKDRLEVILPDLEFLKETTTDRMSKLIFSVERSLLESIYHKLVKIPLVQSALNPLGEILIEVYDSPKNEVSIEKFLRYREVGKLKRYLSFLERLELIRISENSIVYGNRFQVIEDKLKTDNESNEKIYNALLADVLEGGFRYISEYLRLTAIKPFLRWSTSYYLPSLENEGLMLLDKSALINNYWGLYHKRPLEAKATSQLNHLVDAEVFKREGGYLRGTQEVYKNISGSLDI